MHYSERPRTGNYHCSLMSELAMTGSTTGVDILLLISGWAPGVVVSCPWPCLHKVIRGKWHWPAGGRETRKGGEKLGAQELWHLTLSYDMVVMSGLTKQLVLLELTVPFEKPDGESERTCMLKRVESSLWAGGSGMWGLQVSLHRVLGHLGISSLQNRWTINIFDATETSSR